MEIFKDQRYLIISDLQDAATLVFHAAWDNYAGYGFDIGGYRADSKVPHGREKHVLIRWAQFGAMVPLMENGGGGDHMPWLFDDETV